MVQLAKHPKNSQGITGSNSANRRFIKDLEPIIKKHGLENNAEFKECIDWVKNNDPRGYHSLALGLWTNENLDSTEEKALFIATKKAVDNGVEEAQFCYGSLLLFGIGEKLDIEKGLDIMNKAFLKLFSKVFVRHPLGSEMSECLHAVFMAYYADLGRAFQTTTEDDLADVYLKLFNHYNTVSLASQNAISITTIQL